MSVKKYIVLLIALLHLSLDNYAQSGCHAVQLKIYPTKFHANTVGGTKRKPSAVFRIKYTVYDITTNETLFTTTDHKCYIKRNVTATGVYPLNQMNQKEDPFYVTLCTESGLELDLTNYGIRIESYAYGYANCCTPKKNKNVRCDGSGSNVDASFSTEDFSLSVLNDEDSYTKNHVDNDPEFDFQTKIEKKDIPYPQYSIPDEITVCKNLVPFVLDIEDYSYNLKMRFFSTHKTTISKYNPGSSTWSVYNGFNESASTSFTFDQSSDISPTFQGGRYAVYTELNNDCEMTDTFNLTFIDTPFVQSTYETKICQSGVGLIELTPEANHVEFLWKDVFDNCLSRYSSLIVEDTGIYTVKVTGANGCYSRREFPVTYNNNVPIKFESPDLLSCFKLPNTETLELLNTETYESYLWSTGGTSNTIDIDRSGSYSVAATDENGCVSTAIINVIDTCVTPVHSDIVRHSIVSRINKADFEDSDKNKVTLTDPRRIPGSVDYGENDVVKRKFIVRLQYHRNDFSDTKDSIWSLFVPYQITIDNSVMEYRTLHIKKTSAGQDVYESIFEHAGGNEAMVQIDGQNIIILDRNGNSIAFEDIPADINLELELNTLHVPEFTTTTEINTAALENLIDNDNKKVQILWEPVKSSVEYEVQIAFIDELDKNTTVNEALFKQKGWSITTADISFTLDATYPSGTLIYRVRPIGRHTEFVNLNYNHIIYGQWSDVQEIDINNSSSLTPFEQTRNWSKVITFAEEGKKKEVVSFMDGTLRTQQVLTNLNTEKLTLVAETYYDHESRGTLNVLPVPILDNNLKYKPGLAIRYGNPIDKNFVDNEVQLPLDPSYQSASAYYSQNNPFQYSPNNVNINAIPQADGFVSTKVEYSRDNTGRVVKQSGVGSEFSIDNTDNNHVTEYFYATPTQTELNRLFGSNVGRAVYYSKQMVVDPNGQVSVSYLDNKEKVIATALSGNAPANLIDIEKPEPQEMWVNMSENNIRDSLGRLSQSINIIPNDVAGKDYEFHYNVLSDKDNGINDSYCKNCKYKLEISITNPKGESVELNSMALPSYVHFVQDESNVQIKIEGILDADFCCENCDDPYEEIVFNAEFTKLGNYVYTKKLTLLEDDELSIEDYLEQIDFSSVETFIEENIGNYIDTLACRDDCGSRTLVYLRDLRRDDSLNGQIKTQQRYAEINDSLVNAGFCDPFLAAQFDAMEYALKRCDDLLNNIIRQISPDEKYFDTKTYPLIYNSTGSTRDSLIAWGIIASDNTKAAIIVRWQDEWGRKLVDLFKHTIHPEYCHYENCLSDSSFNAFNIKMGLMSGYTEAQQKGYITASGSHENNNRSYSYGSILQQEIYDLQAAGIDIEYELENYIKIRLRDGYLLSEPTNTPANRIRKINIIDATKPRSIFWNPNYLSEPDSGYNSGFLYYRDSVEYDINNNSVINTAEWDSAFWVRFSAGFMAAKMKAIAKYHALSCSYLDDEEALVKNPVISVQQGQQQVASYHTQEAYCASCNGEKPALWAEQLARECVQIRQGFLNPAFKTAVIDSLKDICLRNCGQLNPLAIITHNMVVDGQLTPLRDYIDDVVGGLTSCNVLEILDSGIEYFYNSDDSGNVVINYLCEDQPCSIASIIDIANEYEFNYPKVENLIYREGFDAGTSTEFYADKIYKNATQRNGKIMNKYTSNAGLPYSNYIEEFNDATGDSLGYVLYNYTENIVTPSTPPRYDSIFWGTINPIAVEFGKKYLISYHLTNLSFGNIKINPIVQTRDASYTDTLRGLSYDTVSCLMGWNKFQYFWSPPEGVDSIQIKMFNFEWKFFGNDFLFDEFRIEEVENTQFEELQCENFKPNKLNIKNDEINVNYSACNNSTSGGGMYTLFFADSLGKKVKNIEYVFNEKYTASSPVTPEYQYRNLLYSKFSYSAQTSDSLYSKVYLYIASCATPQWTYFDNTHNQLDFWYLLIAINELDGFNNNYLEDSTNYICTQSFDTCVLRPTVHSDSGFSAYDTLNAQWQPDTSFQSCIDRQINAQIGWLTQTYNDSLSKILTAYQSTHIDNCFKNLSEDFYYKTEVNEYHYTLYYYDLSGNLVQTIPPQGVYPVPSTGFSSTGRWLGGSANEPKHVLKTLYQYNTRSQPIAQHSPDGGLTKYWYNKKGMLILSQNEKQKTETSSPRFSFTHYDALGRIDLVGELVTPDNFTYDPTLQVFLNDPLHPNNHRIDTINVLIKNPMFPLNFVDEAGYELINLTQTEYDYASTIPGINQQNLHNRVSATYSYDNYDKLLSGEGIATIYSYDEIGNVKTLVQDMSRDEELASLPQNAAPEQLKKRIDYDYDLVSGKVNAVVYNNGEEDAFKHRYEYDADNRITEVYTSSENNEIEHIDAKYFYYPHGPLARVELGNEKVQSLDYAYTLQGWLKSINNQTPQYINKYVGKSQVSSILGYYENDYKNLTDTWNNEFTVFAPHYENMDSPKYKGLYNGNIIYTVTDLKGLAKHYATNGNSSVIDLYQNEGNTILGMQYRYDQLNRIKYSYGRTPKLNDISQTATDAYYYKSSNGSWLELFDAFKTNYNYDANGNITKLNRYAPNISSGFVDVMDSFTYHYSINPEDDKLLNNRLYHVNDMQSEIARFSSDIDDQGAFSGSFSTAYSYPNLEVQGGNYSYDKIGQLTQDMAEGINEIKWTPYGKIASIHFETKPDIKFKYDATGNRVAKILTKTGDKMVDSTVTYYFRDAQGNPLDIVQPKNISSTFSEDHEYNIYGSSRIGTYSNTRLFASTISQLPLERTLGKRQYELSNHLGNVLTTITDQKYITDLEEDTDNYYEPVVTTVTDYYPFGMPMPIRSDAASEQLCYTYEEELSVDFTSCSDSDGEDIYTCDKWYNQFRNNIGAELSYNWGALNWDAGERLHLTGIAPSEWDGAPDVIGIHKLDVSSGGSYTVSLDVTDLENESKLVAVVIDKNLLAFTGDIESSMLSGAEIETNGHLTFSFTASSDSIILALIITSSNGINTDTLFGGAMIDNVLLSNNETVQQEVLYVSDFSEGVDGWSSIFSHSERIFYKDTLTLWQQTAGVITIDSARLNLESLSYDTSFYGAGDSAYQTIGILARDYGVTAGNRYRYSVDISDMDNSLTKWNDSIFPHLNSIKIVFIYDTDSLNTLKENSVGDSSYSLALSSVMMNRINHLIETIEHQESGPNSLDTYLGAQFYLNGIKFLSPLDYIDFTATGDSVSVIVCSLTLDTIPTVKSFYIDNPVLSLKTLRDTPVVSTVATYDFATDPATDFYNSIYVRTSDTTISHVEPRGTLVWNDTLEVLEMAYRHNSNPFSSVDVQVITEFATEIGKQYIVSYDITGNLGDSVESTIYVFPFRTSDTITGSGMNLSTSLQAIANNFITLGSKEIAFTAKSDTASVLISIKMYDSTNIFRLDNFVIRETDSFTVASVVSETFNDTAGSWRNSILPTDSGYISYVENEAGKVSWIPSIPAVQVSTRKTYYESNGTPFAGIMSKSFTVDSGQLYSVRARIAPQSDSLNTGICYILNKDSVDNKGLNAFDYGLGYFLYYGDTAFTLPFTATYSGEVLVTFLQISNTEANVVIDSISFTKDKIDSTWFEPFESNINGWRNQILLDQDTMPIVVGAVVYDGSGQRLKVTQGDFKLPADPPNYLDTWGGVAAIDLQVEAGKRYRIKVDIVNPENIDMSQAFAGMVIKNTADLQENGLFASADMFNQNFYQDGNVITGVFNAGNDTTLTALFFIASMKNIQEAARYYYLDNIILEEVRVVKCGEEGTEPVVVNNGNYRFGFNGMEKEPEVSSGGYSAEFWMYESRLGRRWNTDPVVKPWRSSYDAFDNSPIWKLDPNGDDDFFNADGTFKESKGEGTQIRVMTSDGSYKLISQLNPRNAMNRKRLAKVTAYYAGKIGISGTVGLKMNDEEDKTSEKNPAFTEPSGNIYINSRGKNFNKDLDDYNNFKNILAHEKGHKDRLFDDSRFAGHAKVYINQVSQVGFSKTTDNFQRSMTASTAQYILNAHRKEDANSTELIESFNKSTKGNYTLSDIKTDWVMKSDGYTIDEEKSRIYIDIIDKTGKSLPTKVYYDKETKN